MAAHRLVRGVIQVL